MRDEDTSSMIKVWLALEVRQFIHASIQDVRIFQTIDNENKKLTNRFMPS